MPHENTEISWSHGSRIHGGAEIKMTGEKNIRCGLMANFVSPPLGQSSNRRTNPTLIFGIRDDNGLIYDMGTYLRQW
jgi:hypothetical protein